MPGELTLATGLAFLVPIGYALIAASGLPAERARGAAVSVLAALGLAVAGYVATGFALQYGGVGLVHDLPGLDGLVWEWSALGPSWGAGWGMAGLAGWGLTGPAATPGAYALALANLPWVATAALIPVLALRGRVSRWAVALLGILMGAVIYPVAGNWAWGGGWLANLGSNLGLGHGLVDVGGAGLVHGLGAAAALAALLLFAPARSEAAAEDRPVALPPTPLPLLALLGAAALLIGGPAWAAIGPLPGGAVLDPARAALNGVLAAGGGALLALGYTWLVAGRPDPLMAARGFAAGSVAIAASAALVPPWAALLIGAVAGLLIPPAVFLVDRILRWQDAAAALPVHGLAGLLGLLAVGVFADGTAGAGWNGSGPAATLDAARQGISGLLAGAWPAQMQAQLIAAAALAALGFFVAWLALAPLATILNLLRTPSPPPGVPAEEEISVPGAEPSQPCEEGAAT